MNIGKIISACCLMVSVGMCSAMEVKYDNGNVSTVNNVKDILEIIYPSSLGKSSFFDNGTYRIIATNNNDGIQKYSFHNVPNAFSLSVFFKLTDNEMAFDHVSFCSQNEVQMDSKRIDFKFLRILYGEEYPNINLTSTDINEFSEKYLTPKKKH